MNKNNKKYGKSRNFSLKSKYNPKQKANYEFYDEKNAQKDSETEVYWIDENGNKILIEKRDFSFKEEINRNKKDEKKGPTQKQINTIKRLAPNQDISKLSREQAKKLINKLFKKDNKSFFNTTFYGSYSYGYIYSIIKKDFKKLTIELLKDFLKREGNRIKADWVKKDFKNNPNLFSEYFLNQINIKIFLEEEGKKK